MMVALVLVAGEMQPLERPSDLVGNILFFVIFFLVVIAALIWWLRR